MKEDVNMKERKTYSELFLFLAILFVVSLLLSNILAAKILKVGSFSVPAGVLIFPISYIINDVFSEIYGYDKTKKIIIFGFLMNLLMIIVFSLAIVLPAPDWYENSEAFKLILGSTPRICFAGLVAYLCGSLVNSKVMVNMKNIKNNRFSIRAVVSTIFGEFTDSLIFIFIAYIGSMSINQILTMIMMQVILKTLYEMICLPLTTLVIKKVKEYEKIEE